MGPLFASFFGVFSFILFILLDVLSVAVQSFACKDLSVKCWVGQ